MGIASGIFWIVFGLLYILYQAFKEHPSETAAGVVVCVVVVGGIVLFSVISNWLMKVCFPLGFIFTIGSITALLVWAGKQVHDNNVKEKKRHEAYLLRMEEVRKTLTEKDYEDYARKNGWRFYANMNPNSAMYWKKEPYYSKIKFMVELNRDCEMERERKEREAAAGIPDHTSEGRE